MPHYEVTKSYRFEASHRLDGHDGKCARMHGHSYKVDVTVTSDGLVESLTGDQSDEGMVRDFAKLDEVMKPVVDFIDHHIIVTPDQAADVRNQTEYSFVTQEDIVEIRVMRTTAENLAKFFATAVREHLIEDSRDRVEGRPLVMNVEVTVWETEKSRATVRI